MSYLKAGFIPLALSLVVLSFAVPVSASAAATYAVTSKVTLDYKPGTLALVGDISVVPHESAANEHECREGRTATLFKITRDGPFRISSKTSDSEGAFQWFFEKAQQGRFKVVVDPETITTQDGNVLECSGDTETIDLSGGTDEPDSTDTTDTANQNIVIVTANIEEAFDAGKNDLANHFEMDNFASRVKQIVPKIPDVFLLQEVNRKTSQIVASRLSARLGRKYVVAVQPIANTTIEYPDKQVHTETAILLNSRTMATENRGGYFSGTYPSSAAVGLVQVRRHAYMLARAKKSGVKVPLVSLHHPLESSFKTAYLSDYYRGKWSSQLKSLIARKYNANSNRRAPMIAGDFNAGRCYKGDFSNCTVAAWWKKMTDARPEYVEAGREHLVPYGVDAMFTRGRTVAAGWDENGTFRESDRSRFFSHHRLRWAEIEAKS